jgi:DNA modification methylase
MPFDESSQAAPQPDVLCWENGAILIGDVRRALREIPEKSVHCVVTSPPYFGLRDYGVAGQIGNEPTLQAYLDEMVSVFRELRRVLRDDGVFWLNIGDSYASAGGAGTQGSFGDRASRTFTAAGSSKKGVPEGYKHKDLMMVPARLAIALQADGWYLRSQMPWVKRNVMPESVKDRPTSAIEYVYMFTKSTDYFYDHVAVQQPGAIAAGTRAAKGSNVRSELKDVNGRPPEYWDYTGTRNFRNTDLFFTSLEKPHNLITDLDGQPLALDVNPYPFKGAHFATFPPRLVEPLVAAGTSEKGCCPHCGVPWQRVYERTRSFVSGSGRAGNMPEGKNGLSMQGGGATKDVRRGPVISDKTIGWEPCCSCLNVEPLILAATSEKGCCQKCGAQIERVSEKVPAAGRGAGNGFKRDARLTYGERGDETAWTPKANKTIGWKFTCTCFPPPDPVPCTVLDPFAGACTTLMVADRLGRNSIGIELNPDYAKMGLKRIQEDRTKRLKL